LARNADTAYGKQHGFSSISDPASYARNVPLMTPDDLATWVERAMNGEQAVLTADAPAYYVRTTGSTGAPKHVPITAAYKEEFQQTVHIALWHLFRRFPAAFRGRALYFVGSRQVDRAADGTGIGTMSGYNFTELPKVIRGVYAWPYELFEVTDLATRSYLALHLASLGNPSLIAGIFPAPIVYLLRDLAEQAEKLAWHIERGKLPNDLTLPRDQRQFFARDLEPRPDIARRLHSASRAPEGDKALLAWPKLRLVYCWITATAGLYVPELRRRLGPQVAIRDAIYSACEAWCSIPMGEEEPGGPLSITSHYFEFVAEDTFEAADDIHALGSADFRNADQLEDGRRYYIIPTTSAGVYRYVLGDVVEVCGAYHGTPRIRFVRKGGASTNLIGEKLDESHVNDAVAQALRTTGVTTTWFMMVPNRDADQERPGYTLYVELASEASNDKLQELRKAADKALGRASFDYGRVVSGNQLEPLRVERLPAGTYDAHRQARVSAGNAEAQLKIAHLGAALPADIAERLDD
jgi:hypothetical protein